MATATRRVLDPNDPRYVLQDESPDYINDPNAPIEPSKGGTVTVSPTASQESPEQPKGDQTAQIESDPGTIPGGGGVLGITQLPDGQGGTVPVPPPELAPPPIVVPPPELAPPPIVVPPPELAPPTLAPPVADSGTEPIKEPMPWDEPQIAIETNTETYQPPAPIAPPTTPILDPVDLGTQPLTGAPPQVITQPLAEPPPPLVEPPTPTTVTPEPPPFTPPPPPEVPWTPPPPVPFPGATPVVAPPVVDYPDIADVPVPESGTAVTSAATEQPVALPSFSPEQNIIASQVLPTPDPRTLALQEAGDMGLDALATEAPILPTEDPRVDALQGLGDTGLQDLAEEAPIVPQPDPRLLRYREETDALMDKILKGPDRLQMAKDFYRHFDQETEQDYLDSLKDATDAGAAHGQLFSGQLTNKYGDLFQRRARDKDAAKNRFLDEALRETFGDRDRAFNQLGEVENRIFGQGQDERGELRTERENRRRLISDFYGERDKALAEGRNNRNEARGERANRQGTVDQYYAERDKALATGRSDRDETRGERDYQQQTAEAALLNRIRQYMAEQGAEQQDFTNARDLFNTGNTGDPTDTYMDAAEQQALEAAAAAGDTGALLRLLALRRQGAGQGLTPAGG